MIEQDIIHLQRLVNHIFAPADAGELAAKQIYEAYRNFKGMPQEQIFQLYAASDLPRRLTVSLSPHEFFILLCTVAPFVYSGVYSHLSILLGRDEILFAELGGRRPNGSQIFYPTAETILYFFAGSSVRNRINFEAIFDTDGKLFQHNLLGISTTDQYSSRLSGQLYPTEELLALVKGKEYVPEYSGNFPASQLKTRMEWDDLVLPYETLEALDELKIWMQHGSRLQEHKDLNKRIKPGYRTLFYGPPGTGKTLTASLIGKLFQMPVYRIDLSMVVSKWVGETEKNLKSIFDQAIHKQWVLFFDEADSLFGKRTQTKSSNDKYANQEVSYLLQRIEDFPGLIILASNLKSNMDEAFNRRFQSMILFPMPDEEMRYELWLKAFPKDFTLAADIDLRKLAKQYELAGGAITNIIRFCVLKAYDRGKQEIWAEDVEQAILREFRKSGKIMR